MQEEVNERDKKTIVVRLRNQVLCPKGLGAYLVVLSLYQSVAYAYLSDMTGLDPRAGISMVMEGMIRKSHRATDVMEWASVVWLFGLGVAFLFGKYVFRTYIISEVLLAAPTILLLISWSPYLFFSSFAWFAVMILVFSVFTVLPIGIAISLLRRGKQARAT